MRCARSAVHPVPARAVHDLGCVAHAARSAGPVDSHPADHLLVHPTHLRRARRSPADRRAVPLARRSARSPEFRSAHRSARRPPRAHHPCPACPACLACLDCSPIPTSMGSRALPPGRARSAPPGHPLGSQPSPRARRSGASRAGLARSEFRALAVPRVGSVPSWSTSRWARQSAPHDTDCLPRPDRQRTGSLSEAHGHGGEDAGVHSCSGCRF